MNQADYQLIEKKIDGTLSAEEAQKFEQRLQQDLIFVERYEQEQAAVNAFRYGHHQTLKRDLQVAIQEARQKKQSRRSATYRWAAVWLVLLASAALIYRYARPDTPAMLYASYYEPYQPVRTIRGDAFADANDYDQGVRLYQSDRHQAVISFFTQELPNRSPRSEQALLLLGNSYLQTQAYQAAADVFSQLIQSEDALLQQTGAWYKALSYLGMGRVDSARELLGPLSESSMYQKEASEILAAL